MGNIYKFSTRIKRKKCMKSHELSQLYFVLCRKKECKVIIDKSEKKNNNTCIQSGETPSDMEKSDLFTCAKSALLPFAQENYGLHTFCAACGLTLTHRHTQVQKHHYTSIKIWGGGARFAYTQQCEKKKKSYVNTKWFLYPFSNTWSTLAGLMGLVKYLALTSKPCSLNQMVLLGQPWLQ